ncbi:MAG: hypothetical protein ACTIC7_07720, partial [Lactiplantibacillus plantarum]
MAVLRPGVIIDGVFCVQLFRLPISLRHDQVGSAPTNRLHDRLRRGIDAERPANANTSISASGGSEVLPGAAGALSSANHDRCFG